MILSSHVIQLISSVSTITILLLSNSLCNYNCQLSFISSLPNLFGTKDLVVVVSINYYIFSLYHFFLFYQHGSLFFSPETCMMYKKIPESYTSLEF